eukprot:TRINITY_DN173_c0_g1_i1.p1 TRINITY_DN173_c0_g1~~TRINITY_DN173_c0_g1_i1.p1  ORF type:complete len:264 (+),score=87.18 TRINITY_DN173_c0_g1_i1:120-911(+)
MPIDTGFSDKVAVVTGAGTGLGKATAINLAEQGVKVVLSARRREKLVEVLEEIRKVGGEGYIVETDVSKEEEVKRMYIETIDKYGRLDFVVVNAGMNGVWAPIEDLTFEEFSKTIDTNLNGTFLTMKYAVPHLKKQGGAMVVVSSVNGTRIFSNTGATAYAATKAAQNAMAKMLAPELAKFKIRVNVVCPGRIESDIHGNTELRNMEGIRLPIEYPEGEIPLTGKEAGKASQVADLVSFLCSKQSSHITGTEVWIDGGQSLLQ